jgi:hypothetical protein
MTTNYDRDNAFWTINLESPIRRTYTVPEAANYIDCGIDDLLEEIDDERIRYVPMYGPKRISFVDLRQFDEWPLEDLDIDADLPGHVDAFSIYEAAHILGTAPGFVDLTFRDCSDMESRHQTMIEEGWLDDGWNEENEIVVPRYAILRVLGLAGPAEDARRDWIGRKNPPSA